VREPLALELLPDCLGDMDGPQQTRVGQHHSKLFAAISGDQVAAVPDNPANRVGNLLEAAVARLVAVGVVIALEEVNIAAG
jgi:hypothetical protein